jgi:hypothetical protein
MASDNNIILDIPFDEPKNSQIAYDFSKNRADGVVTNSSFVAGKQGNCIKFDGNGYCDVSQNIIPLTANFTLLAWIKRGVPPDDETGKNIGFWFYFDDKSSNTGEWISISNDWNYIAVVKDGLNVSIYVNTVLTGTITLPAQPAGFAILQDIYFTRNGYGLIDELRVYDVAFSQEEIGILFTSLAQLNYSIDGINFKEFDVTVSDSAGVLDLPKSKEPFSVDWPDYHGTVVDLTKRRVGVREIELKCWIKAAGYKDFATKVNSFTNMFRKSGTHRLSIDIHPTKPLVYEVYNDSGISISKRWRSELMAGTFTLKLTEPEPVKRVIRHQKSSAGTKTLTITLTSDKVVTVYWGDGTQDEMYGTNISRSHQYDKDGIYYAIVAGVIEEITSFSTNGIIVWHLI